MEYQGQERLLTMLKALADESLLTLFQMLHEREHMVGELAGRVGLTEPTVSHHLALLRKTGLVTLRMEGNRRFYHASEGGLAQLKRMVGDIEHLPPAPVASDDRWIDALDWGEADRQVLRDYTHSGQLTYLPVRQQKLIVILCWLATLFQPDRLYREPEVNTILKSVYESDYVSLRRDLVDFGYLRRERGGGKYWLTPADEAASSPR